MKKLFISQPMKGKTDKYIKAERDKAILEAENLLHEPVEITGDLLVKICPYRGQTT